MAKRVTHACSNCQSQHLKCNGINPCSRCRAKNLNCVYTTQKMMGPAPETNPYDGFTTIFQVPPIKPNVIPMDSYDNYTSTFQIEPQHNIPSVGQSFQITNIQTDLPLQIIEMDTPLDDLSLLSNVALMN